MRRFITYTLMCMIMVAITSCHKDSDDYTTSCEIELILSVEGEMEVIQYSIEMMNLNTRDVVTAAGKTQDVITVSEILRGAYSINIEGVVRYRNADGDVFTQSFRVQSEYVLMVDNDNKIELEMTLMGT